MQSDKEAVGAKAIVLSAYPEAEARRSYGRWRIYDGPQTMTNAAQPLGEWRGWKDLAWVDAASRLRSSQKEESK